MDDSVYAKRQSDVVVKDEYKNKVVMNVAASKERLSPEGKFSVRGAALVLVQVSMVRCRIGYWQLEHDTGPIVGVQFKPALIQMSGLALEWK